MTRGNARELAVHLIYSREFTGEEPEQVVSARLEKAYYDRLGAENEIYAERPSKAQIRYLDTVVTGVANREEELNSQISKFSIGWQVSRISRLTRCILQLAIFEILYVEDVPTGVAVAEAAEELLKLIPCNEEEKGGGVKKYKCKICGAVFEVPEGEEPVCPVCKARGENLELIEE